MIQKLICYKDTKLNIYTHPIFIDGDRDNVELIEMVRRMCAEARLPKIYFEYDLYVLGKFDDKTASFDVHDPEFLVSLGDFKHLAPVAEKDEVASDVVEG